MKYQAMEKALFLERPNRFIAYVDTERGREICHVKNTGRCKELLHPGVEVYVCRNEDPKRKTPLDLISVRKEGDPRSDGKNRLINMDSQAPNEVVREALEAGRILPHINRIHPEYTYGDSRFDFYVETEDGPVFLEVKGVTLERNGDVCFPDAPTERGVKHLRELIACKQEGYRAYVVFVIQMRPVGVFYPNEETHPAFGQALRDAMEAGVQVLAYDCCVTEDSLQLGDPVPVCGSWEQALLRHHVPAVREWFAREARVLPWRERQEADGTRFRPSAYEVWVSEIMLQQTRVEAVKGYYARFMRELPTVADLARVSEDVLLKLWEGLGYYNRARNMQKCARVLMERYEGEFPRTYEELVQLPGIGSYTAGAIASNAFACPVPAVDGNVLRVLSRFLGSTEPIDKPAVKKQTEQLLQPILPTDHPGLFNQALMEIGACVCLPNGRPKCENCPLSTGCRALKEDRIEQLPVKSPKKERRIEDRTILLIRNGREVLIQKRPATGLLAGMYEFINLPEHLSEAQVDQAVQELGLEPLYVEKLDPAKHIFSHVEWHMEGYLIQVAEPEQNRKLPDHMVFAEATTVQQQYALPSAYRAYASGLTILQGNEALE